MPYLFRRTNAPLCLLALITITMMLFAMLAHAMAADAVPVVAAGTSAHTVSVAPVTSVDFSPVINAIFAVLASALPIVASIVLAWLAPKAAKLLHVNINAGMLVRLNDVLNKAIAYGINQAHATLAAKGMTVDVKNSVLQYAITYAEHAAPDVLTHFGINSPDDLTTRILARWETHPAVVAVTLPPVPKAVPPLAPLAVTKL